MTAATIIEKVTAAGVTLALSPPDNIKVVGNEKLVDRWLPVIRGNKPGIVAALKEASNIDTAPEAFCFSPPGDPANDDEALEERIAIMVEGGMSEARALQEARWRADKERSWRAHLRNAQRVLEAPKAHQEALLSRYRDEATRRYGEATGRDMALFLASWVNARKVH